MITKGSRLGVGSRKSLLKLGKGRFKGGRSCLQGWYKVTSTILRHT